MVRTVQAEEEGGQVYEILTESGGSLAEAARGQAVLLAFGRGQVALSRVRLPCCCSSACCCCDEKARRESSALLSTPPC